MISNFVQRTRKSALLEEREKLVIHQEQLSALMRACGVTKNAARKAKVGHLKIDERTLMARENASFQMEANRKRLIEIKGLLREIHEDDDVQRNKKLLEVFKDIFTREQLAEIREEADRRMNGTSGFKMSFSVRDSIRNAELAATYKKVALEHLEKMVEFRIMLTKVIDDGCEKFGKADFLTVISPLNRLIIPINELNKAKLKLQSL